MKGYLSMTGLAVGVFVVLLVFTFTGVVRRCMVASPLPRVTSHVHVGKDTKKVFFYVHGFPGHRREEGVAQALVTEGDVIGLRYSAWISNTRPLEVARALAREIGAQAAKAPDKQIVLIGESMGALLLRRAFLEAGKEPWTDRVTRIVLLAGLNRGWDLTGHKPSDMSGPRWAVMYFFTWLGRLTDSGRLAMGLESGSPFVANLRLDWMDSSREGPLAKLEVVQLRGDIDDLVSEEDSRDLDSVSHAKYASLRVRGTGHGDVANFSDRAKFGGQSIGTYRREKFVLAATGSLDDVQRKSEQDPYQVDPTVTHVVFVLHGIRDLGKWAAAFEQDLQREFAAMTPAPTGRLVVASSRYGYLGMGPFLLLAKRQHYVQWLMDEYTEVRARYPNARDIHFFGHSNGTYLLAAALEDYPSLQIGRVAFGGSVVGKRYNWAPLFEQRRVESVRNYVAADDWVVALFPRFFEPRLMRWVFANDLGSAGFNGFEPESANVQNVRFLEGGHGAFETRTREISRFLLSNDRTIEPPPRQARAGVLKQGSSWATWFFVWPVLGIVLAFVGWHVVMSATEPRWPFVMGYVSLVLFILKNA
jgi:pimeloyl-ACP methyl ester carboxylesterase